MLRRIASVCARACERAVSVCAAACRGLSGDYRRVKFREYLKHIYKSYNFSLRDVSQRCSHVINIGTCFHIINIAMRFTYYTRNHRCSLSNTIAARETNIITRERLMLLVAARKKVFRRLTDSLEKLSLFFSFLAG